MILIIDCIYIYKQIYTYIHTYIKRMLLSSKMDRTALNEYSYDGKMMQYLYDLEFTEARAIFMTRYRRWPTKRNFPGRWDGFTCNFCNLEDTDEHIFKCPGYKDIMDDNTQVVYSMFWDKHVLKDNVKLKSLAALAIKVIERLELAQKLKQ